MATRARPLTRPDPSASVTTPVTSLPAGSTTWPLIVTGDRSVARTGSSTRLVSDPTADDSDSRNVVPDGIVTSVYRATGATGAEVAAEIGAFVVSPVVAAGVSVAVFSGAFAPLHAASPTVKAITQAHFILKPPRHPYCLQTRNGSRMTKLASKPLNSSPCR